MKSYNYNIYDPCAYGTVCEQAHENIHQHFMNFNWSLIIQLYTSNFTHTVYTIKLLQGCLYYLCSYICSSVWHANLKITSIFMHAFITKTYCRNSWNNKLSLPPVMPHFTTGHTRKQGNKWHEPHHTSINKIAYIRV
jgi:hypothetical protein